VDAIGESKFFGVWNPMSPKIKICKEADCNDQATTKGLCRFHYLKTWTNSKKDSKRGLEDLNRYVENVVKNNPDSYISEISKDLNRWGGRDGSHRNNKDRFLDPYDSEEDVEGLLDNLKIDDDY